METESLTIDGPNSRNVETNPTLHLVLVWSRREENRLGEVSPVSKRGTLGRGPDRAPGDPPKLEMFRQRPGLMLATGHLECASISRRQWLVAPKGDALLVENTGKRALLHNGVPCQKAEAHEGDLLAVEGAATFLVEKRPRLVSGSHSECPFGLPDEHGIVGESLGAWRMRRELRFLAEEECHVLILGESGTGKELAAQAIHRHSARSAKKLVARNAASIPTSLVEAELFGNARNYPNAGMTAREGLIGSANGSTLFLDEIGELAEEQQANLLRVLDGGEYQRLGDDAVQRSSLRLVAATNRSPGELKSDFSARFKERLELSGLNERRADIPLLCRHLLVHSLKRPEKKLAQQLLEALIRHEYTHHTRELERLLRLAVRQSDDEALSLTKALEKELALPQSEGEPTTQVELNRDTIVDALSSAPTISAAAEQLGLTNRYTLYRLMKKFGIERRVD